MLSAASAIASREQAEDRFELTPKGEAYLAARSAACGGCGADVPVPAADGLCAHCRPVELVYERSLETEPPSAA